jgi:hypothetical protein
VPGFTSILHTTIARHHQVIDCHHQNIVLICCFIVLQIWELNSNQQKKIIKSTKLLDQNTSNRFMIYISKIIQLLACNLQVINQCLKKQLT